MCILSEDNNNELTVLQEPLGPKYDVSTSSHSNPYTATILFLQAIVFGNKFIIIILCCFRVSQVILYFSREKL